MKKFVKSSIINYPTNTNRRWFAKDINLSSFAVHLSKSSNYSKNVKSFLEEGEYWEIKNLSDFLNLRDDIQNISRQKSFRTLEEFNYLLSFVFEEKIQLFIGKDIKPSGKEYAAAFYRNHNSIVVNSLYLLDVDAMCESLTHELIHYLQLSDSGGINGCIPLNIDIEDGILTDEYLNFYDNYYGADINVGDVLRTELEAKTFEYFPDFIKKYKQNKNQFSITSQRSSTIEWICNNKQIPNYASESSSYSENQLKQIDFETGEIREIKSSKNKDSEKRNARGRSDNYFYEEALKYFQSGEYKKAINFFNSIIDSEEFNVWTKKEQGELFNNRAMSFYYLGKYASAYEDLTKVISLFSSKSKDLNLYWTRAKCSYYSRKYSDAISDLDYVIKLNQDHYFYYYRGSSKKLLADSTPHHSFTRSNVLDVKDNISYIKNLYEDALRDSEFAIKSFKNDTVTKEEKKIREFEDLRSSILEAIVKFKNKTNTNSSKTYKNSQSSNTSNSNNSFRVNQSYQDNKSGCATVLLGVVIFFLFIFIPQIAIFVLIFALWKIFDNKSKFTKR